MHLEVHKFDQSAVHVHHKPNVPQVQGQVRPPRLRDDLIE
jgi:hypothetical protein